ncbi:unnamed protein product [Blumeria hordei]|uniref:Uncharacterized protein n=2 Tax=Blumeria hordei TaxID=2867405 RepID=A0A383UML4_BLUHO|nr:CSEP0047 putative effector protein [Blumeria hordei DH14]SZF00522.1 unnamed protein product [Blumeria hordei]
MKFPVSLVTIAISTVALAYCVPPSSQPTLPEGQEVISNSLKVPGENALEYCSSEFLSYPIRLFNVAIKPTIPTINEQVEVFVDGFTGIPLSPEVQLRVFDWASGRDLSEPINFFKYMNSINAQVPDHVGQFRLFFRFKPEPTILYSGQIGIELNYRKDFKLLCVKTPIRIF